ncbi:MAG: hypothetical protein CL808_00390 [Citromicrobium sp.]|nr:hypothetical protein [Citromicrobium sp.]
MRVLAISVLLVVSGFIGAFGMLEILSFLVWGHPISYPWVGAGIIAWIFYRLLWTKKRPCGHGAITDGEPSHFFGYVINPCPVCGDDLNDPD